MVLNSITVCLLVVTAVFTALTIKEVKKGRDIWRGIEQQRSRDVWYKDEQRKR